MQYHNLRSLSLFELPSPSSAASPAPSSLPNAVVVGSVFTIAGSSTTAALADGYGSFAAFNSPSSLALFPGASAALVADTNSNAIRHIVLSTGLVTTIAGQAGFGYADGPTFLAKFSTPAGIAIDAGGAKAVVADLGNFIVRIIDLPTAIVETLAGVRSSGVTDGISSAARFQRPSGVAFNANGSVLFVVSRPIALFYLLCTAASCRRMFFVFVSWLSLRPW